jgi:hypothetical protein
MTTMISTTSHVLIFTSFCLRRMPQILHGFTSQTSAVEGAPDIQMP